MNLFSNAPGGRKRRRKATLGAPPDPDSVARAAQALLLADPIRRLERVADDLDDVGARGVPRLRRKLYRVARYLRDIAADIYLPKGGAA